MAGMMAASFAATDSAEAKTVIKVAHGANEKYHMHRAIEEFKRLVEEGSKGEIEVQIFPSSQMGPDREMIEGVQTGVLEMAVPPSSFFAGWDPAFAVIELPYMYPSKEIALKTFHSPAGDEMLARLAKQDLVGLGWLENGVRHVTNNVRPITGPADLDGIKLRTMKVPAHVDTFKALGANPTPMNFGEVYSGLQQGVIDGQENPVAHIYAQRFYEVQKYMSTTGHVFTVYIPVIRKSFFEQLPEEQQNLLREAMRKAEDYQQELVGAEEAQQLAEIQEAGVTVLELTPDQRKAFIEDTKSVREEYREQVGEDVYDAWDKAVDAAETGS
jgi:tripartite ATP-independent transporter DctP family solute receptor